MCHAMHTNNTARFGAPHTRARFDAPHTRARLVAATAIAALAVSPLTPLPLGSAQGQEPVAEEAPASASVRTAAPNTDHCPNAVRPPEATTTSERLAPGQPSPTPPAPVAGAVCGISAPPGFQVDPDVFASAWIVTDLDTGEIIAAKDPHGRYRPASIIKALLAMVVINELDLNQQITVTEESTAIDGSAVGIGAGGTYTVDQLLHGLLMASGNDAAHALAQALGGDEQALAKVNRLAKDLGAASTYAATYSGLDAPGMSTSAYDMALIYQAAFKNPTFAQIVSTEKYDFPGYGDLPGYEVWNDNQLFLNDPDGIGGKTGYTDDAHHTFVGALDRNGRRLMAVLLDTTIEHGPRAWQQAQALLHESYDVVPPGGGIGKLTPLSGAHATTATATPTPAAGADAEAGAQAQAQERGGQSQAEQSRAVAQTATGAQKSATNYPVWLGWVVIAGVGLLLIMACWVVLRGKNRKRGRHSRR